MSAVNTQRGWAGSTNAEVEQEHPTATLHIHWRIEKVAHIYQHPSPPYTLLPSVPIPAKVLHFLLA